MHTKIVLGPQHYTFPVELEAEVRRLLWAQLRPRRDHARLRLRLIRGGAIAGSLRNSQVGQY